MDPENPSEEKGKSFWTTVPGILTGLATLVTAVGGLIIVIRSSPEPPPSEAGTAPPPVVAELPAPDVDEPPPPVVKLPPPPPAYEILLGKNLVKNPGAEEGIRYWQVPTGYEVRKKDPRPHGGAQYFFAGPNKSAVEAVQEVDLSDFAPLIEAQALSCSVTGYMRNFEGKDESQIITDFVFEDGSIADRIESKVVKDKDDWIEFHKEHRPRQGTVTAKLILRSTYRAGQNNNDGYFDDLELICTKTAEQ